MQSLLSSVLYDTLLTPKDLLQYIANRDFVHSDTSPTQLTLTKEKTSGIARVIRIPLLPPSSLPEKQEYHLEIDVALSDPGTEDADIAFLLSDNIHFVGVVVPDRNERATLCYGLEGRDMFPRGVNRRRSSLTEINKWFEMPTDSRESVRRVQLLFKPYQSWGACLVNGVREFINSLKYENMMDTSRPLFLDVYLDNDEEVHNLLYIHAKLVLKDR